MSKKDKADIATPLNPLEMAKVAAGIRPEVAIEASDTPPVAEGDPGVIPEMPEPVAEVKYRVLETADRVRYQGGTHRLVKGKVLSESSYGFSVIESIRSQGVKLERFKE